MGIAVDLPRVNYLYPTCFDLQEVVKIGQSLDARWRLLPERLTYNRTVLSLRVGDPCWMDVDSLV